MRMAFTQNNAQKCNILAIATARFNPFYLFNPFSDLPLSVQYWTHLVKTFSTILQQEQQESKDKAFRK